jgi:hypothetical protein
LFLPQKLNLIENCSSRGFSAVRGSPKFEFGLAGRNRHVDPVEKQGSIGFALGIGVVAKLPINDGTIVVTFPTGHATDPCWIDRVRASL